jgi:hypothetical protein
VQKISSTKEGRVDLWRRFQTLDQTSRGWFLDQIMRSYCLGCALSLGEDGACPEGCDEEDEDDDEDSDVEDDGDEEDEDEEGEEPKEGETT